MYTFDSSHFALYSYIVRYHNMGNLPATYLTVVALRLPTNSRDRRQSLVIFEDQGLALHLPTPPDSPECVILHWLTSSRKTLSPPRRSA